MIRIKTTINVDNETFGIKEYKHHKSCMLEHIGLIVFLIEMIKQQDETLTDKEIFKMIKDVRKIMEENRNDKSSTKDK